MSPVHLLYWWTIRQQGETKIIIIIYHYLGYENYWATIFWLFEPPPKPSSAYALGCCWGLKLADSPSVEWQWPELLTIRRSCLVKFILYVPYLTELRLECGHTLSMYTFRRSGYPLSTYVCHARRQERACVVRGTRKAASVRHVLDRRRQRNDGVTRRSYQWILDFSDGWQCFCCICWIFCCQRLKLLYPVRPMFVF